jgi:hypothetical protein
MGLRPGDLTDEQFVAAFHAAGCSPTQMARATGLSMAPIYARLNRLREKGVDLPSIPTKGAPRVTRYSAPARAYAQREAVRFPDGVAVVFSDAHWWPGVPRTVAHEAMLRLIRTIEPGLIIATGDVLDGAAISRHEPEGWQTMPSVIAELETVKEHMAGIEAAAPGARLLRTIGNHDIRFDKRLAIRVPDYRHLAGMMLRDHLPAWREAWSYEINGAVMVKHRWHNGVHAAHNNVLKSGRTIVTGHLHRLLATPYADYNGRRWGVDTGTLSEPRFAQFDYAEDAPKNWGSGFAVLTFRRGKLLPPEFCEVINGEAFFRGEVVHGESTKRTGAGSGLRGRGSQAKRGGDVPSGVGSQRPDARPHAPDKRGAAARRGAAA